ncbi:MAG: acyltransferase family protein [Edaphobacter sp.]
MARSADLPILQKHMPELDILRGCAVLAVFFYHGLYWTGATSSNHLAHLFIKSTVVGWLGVNLFFVLSGFLITGVLMDAKGRTSFYRNFYLRRALRILPAYLALIAILILVGWLQFRSAMVALLFIANYDYFLRFGGYGPLWSLSVEEQFYLLWPTIVGRVSTRTLLIISTALCLLEPLLRWLSASGHLPLGNDHTLTYLIADNLALGALAAIFARSTYGTLRNGINLGLALGLSGLVVLAVGYPFGILHRTSAFGAAFQIVPWNLVFTGALLLSLGLRSPLASSAWTAPLRFFGNISYGLYLVHVLIFVRYDDNVPHISNPALRHFMQEWFVRFVITGGISILIAWLSRIFYEERFLQMGRGRRPSAPGSTPPNPALEKIIPASPPVTTQSTPA